MGFDREACFARAIAEARDEHGDVAPPWARYPEIPAGSIGWRMGCLFENVYKDMSHGACPRRQ